MTLTTQLLIAKVTQLTAVCEAVVADNARLSGRIEAILALMGPRSVPCTPSPVPPHFTDGTAAGRLSPAVPVVAAFPIRDEPQQAPRLMFFADGQYKEAFPELGLQSLASRLVVSALGARRQVRGVLGASGISRVRVHGRPSAGDGAGQFYITYTTVRHSPSISVTLDFPCSPRAAALPHTRIATVVTSVHATRFLTTACDAARHG